MPILKHRLELEGISHVVSLVSFSDVKAEENTSQVSRQNVTAEFFIVRFYTVPCIYYFRYLIIRLTKDVYTSYISRIVV